MPPSTRNLTPVIVYLPPAVKAKLERLAKDEDRSSSYVARAILEEALRQISEEEKALARRPAKR